MTTRPLPGHPTPRNVQSSAVGAELSGATATLAELGGDADAHPADDVCPRVVAPPGVPDPFPDGTIRDKGCGTLRPDKTCGD